MPASMTPAVDASTAASCNIAAHLPAMARRVPNQPAVIVTQRRNRGGRVAYTSVTFAELERLSNRYARGLAAHGFTRGMRVLLMVRPGVNFIALTFALFKIGAPPVMIDPGMGVSRLLECIRAVNVEGFIGVPLAHVLRRLRPGPFATLGPVVTVGRRWCWGGATLRDIQRCGGNDPVLVHAGSREVAAILFTSGSTGPAKGVVYEHGIFDAQVRMIRDHYGIEPGEIDLPAFPLFALFSTAMGMTCVIPDMDPARPARVDPAKIVQAIQDHQVTNTFGSPAIWKRVAPFCVERGIKLPSLKRILIAGAPVPPRTIAQLLELLQDNAEVHTPYGATESLPVSSISGRALLGRMRRSGAASRPQEAAPAEAAECGAGTCVGVPLPGMEVRMIRITDEPIVQWTDDLLVADGTPGEIIVSGCVVTRSYYARPQATAAAKIHDHATVWHRMGDVGYRDALGRIWFCGRKSQRVSTAAGLLFADQCEAVFQAHSGVARAALVGVGPVGAQQPVLIVELRDGRLPKRTQAEAIRAELIALGQKHELTRTIRTILFHRCLPVDVRHNVKINRERLARWAAQRLTA